ncbi:NAD(P)H-binding protein [Glycomyces terrestris]|uniref:NAD-dependent epimerase/dehydratase family protein n=1 Tax=Glycomyces terrestris TaxID=2493553 RepID=A0A426V4P0_9ACTN|nr:NAD(P)H-binding protein [Glycomyces terrestris]RRS01788.1 NAD-dependent epimerase/dehydratase family protein [Glycomyces terrestris]
MSEHIANDTILVTGATGKVGRRLVEILRDAGREVRAVSRSTEIPFDWTDSSTWDKALEGVTAVYIIAPDHPFPAEEFAAAAAKAGVRRLVAQSGRRVQDLAAAAGVGPEAIGMYAAQAAVQGSGIEWTVLQPNNFNENFSEGDYLPGILAGEIALPLADTTEPLIAVADIAAVAAAVLTEDGHHGQVYELTGPESLTMGEAAAAIAAASGKTVVYRAETPEEHDAALRAAQLPEELVGFLNLMYQFMREGNMSPTTDNVERILGRAPIAFADWAFDAAKAGAWTQA